MIVKHLNDSNNNNNNFIALNLTIHKYKNLICLNLSLFYIIIGESINIINLKKILKSFFPRLYQDMFRFLLNFFFIFSILTGPAFCENITVFEFTKNELKDIEG